MTPTSFGKRDLEVAFDSVNHEILLSKLTFYGIEACENSWFKSYLSNRYQRCLVNGFLSSSRQIECGVPQGSILGPLLFLLYINDLPNCLDHTIPCLYADDTQIYASSQNPEELTSFINSDLERIQDWLAVNKLNMEIKHNRTKIGEQCPSWNHIYGRNGIEIKKIKYAINVFSI